MALSPDTRHLIESVSGVNRGADGSQHPLAKPEKVDVQERPKRLEPFRRAIKVPSKAARRERDGDQERGRRGCGANPRPPATMVGRENVPGSRRRGNANELAGTAACSVGYGGCSRLLRPIGQHLLAALGSCATGLGDELVEWWAVKDLNLQPTD